MDEQLIAKSIYHPGGPLTDQDQLLGRTSLYKEDGTPLSILSADEVAAGYLSPAKLFPITSFGAKDDGSDCYTAIVAATTAARLVGAAGWGTSKKAAVVFPPSATGWYCSQPVSILDVDVLMYSPLIYTGVGAMSAPALTVGSDAYSLRQSFIIRVKRLNANFTWENANDIGCRIKNVQTADQIDLLEAQGFTIGFQCMADGQGFVYNHINLGSMYDCRCGIELTNKSSGWINENLFLNGTMRNSSNLLVGTDRTGIRITSSDGSYTGNNNNVFVKPSIELNADGLPIDIVHGFRNSFIRIRSEGNRTDYAVITRNASQDNEFDFGFATNITKIYDSGTYPSSILKNGLNPQTTRPRYSTVFRLDNAVKFAYDTDGAGAVGLSCLTTMSSSNALRWLGLSTITIGSDHVVLPNNRAFGVFIDTSVVKTFHVNVKSKNTAGRIFVQPYDSANTQLTNAGPNHPYVKGTSSSGLSWSSSSGGVYITGSDGNVCTFTVGSDVSYCFVGITGAATPTQLTGFVIEALEYGPSGYWTHKTKQNGVNAKYATAPPSVGTYEVGDVIWKDNPSAGSSPGWVCVTAGTPGTWKAMANLSA